MNKKRVSEYITNLLKIYGVEKKQAQRIKEAFNCSAISHDLEGFEKKGVSDDEIAYLIIESLKKGAQKGGKGKYYRKGISKRIREDVEQIGKIEIPRVEPRLLYSPFRDTFRKIADVLVSNPYTSKETKKDSADLSKLNAYEKTVGLLKKIKLVGDREAKGMEKGLRKKKEKLGEDLVTRIKKETLSSAVAVILLFIIGLSLFGYSVFNPSITGYVVLESGQSVSLGIIFGIAFIIVAFGFLYVRRILKNKK